LVGEPVPASGNGGMESGGPQYFYSDPPDHQEFIGGNDDEEFEYGEEDNDILDSYP